MWPLPFLKNDASEFLFLILVVFFHRENSDMFLIMNIFLLELREWLWNYALAESE